MSIEQADEMVRPIGKAGYCCTSVDETRMLGYSSIFSIWCSVYRFVQANGIA